MKFTINAKTLATCVAEAAQFCTNAGLDSCIRMNLSENALELRARTQRNGYVETIEVSGAEDGIAVVPAKRLLDILNQMPPEDTEFSMKDGNLVIKQKGIRFKLKSTDAGTHFNLSVPEEWTILPAEFGTMIPRIAFAASTDATKFSMTGIRFQHRDGKLDVVATDGKRMCFGIIDDDGDRDMTLPASFALLAVKRGAERMAIADNLAWFRKGSRMWVSTLITAQYPAYLRVIPTPREDSVTISVSAQALADAVRRVTLLSDAKLHNRITLTVSGSEMTVSASSEMGTARETVPCVSSADTEMCFQSRYILDLLKTVTGNELSIIRSGEYSPVLFLDGDPSWKGIIMPMNKG